MKWFYKIFFIALILAGTVHAGRIKPALRDYDQNTKVATHELVYQNDEPGLSPAETLPSCVEGQNIVHSHQFRPFPFKLKPGAALQQTKLVWSESSFQQRIKPVLHHPESVFFCVYRI